MCTLNRQLAVLLLAALAVAVTIAVVLIGPPARATTPDGYGRAAVGATNAVRRTHALHTLRPDRCLQRFAARQAGRMATQRRMFHQDVVATLRRCHLRSVGENVAVGYGTGRAVVRGGWMQSPPHRANILHRSFRIVAVAARRGSDGQWYASQLLAER
jgi:uncharacterized protein YkwD